MKNTYKIFIAGAFLFSNGALHALNPVFKPDRGTYVNMLTRDYGEEFYDISFYVPGQALSLHRVYKQGSGWDFDLPFEALIFNKKPSNPAVIESIEKDDQTFTDSGATWTYANQSISITGTGYRFEDAVTGEWINYDIDGKAEAFGRDSEDFGTISYTGDDQIDQIIRPDSTVIADFDYAANGLVARAVNNGGAEVIYAYNGNNLTSFTDIRGEVTTYAYTNDLISEKVIPGNITRLISYDASYGDVSSITDENGQGSFYEYSYDANFKEYFSKITYSTGKVVEQYYNSNRDLSRVVVNGKTIVEYDYLDDGNRILTTDALGNVTEKILTVNDTVQTLILPDGNERKTVMQFDSDDGDFRTIREVDASGFETRYGYDSLDRLTSTIEAYGTDFQREYQFTYDSLGNIKTKKLVADAITAEAITTYNYDQYGRLIEIVYPEGNSEEYSYDEFNRIISSADGLGNEVVNTYDAATGDLLTRTTPLGHTTTYTYNSFGLITSITNQLNETYNYTYTKDSTVRVDPMGGVFTVIFDSHGNAVKSIDPSGIETVREYDSNGRTLKVIDGNGNVVEAVYNEEICRFNNMGADLVDKLIYPTFEKSFTVDSRYRTVEETYSYGDTEVANSVLSFTGVGYPTAVKDAMGNITNYEYNAFGKVIRKTSQVTGQTKIREFNYDDAGNLVAVKLNGSLEYHFSYDRNGRQIVREMTDGTQATLEYDANGQVLRLFTPNGGKVEYDWDADGRPISQSYYKLADDENPDMTYTFIFDGADRMKSVSDGEIVITYQHDALGRQTTESVDYGTGVVLAHSLTYYSNGQLKTFTGPDGIPYTYTYDNASLLATISAQPMGSVSWASYEWSKPTEIKYPGGMTRTLSYTGFQEVASIQVTDPNSNVLFNESYDRNNVNKVTTRTSTDGTVNYSYDEDMQLTGASSTDPDVPNEAFSYDLNANRTADLSGTSYAYNDLNALIGVGSDVLGYDDNGNLISRTRGADTYSYEYNTANRLTKILKNTVEIASYRYDPLGRRAWKELNGVRTYFHYSVMGLIAEADVAGNVTKSYGYELNGFSNEQGTTPGLRPLFQKEGGNYYYFVNDHNFRQRMLIKSDGTVAWKADTSSFGITIVDNASFITCNLRLSNQYYDGESGLHYNMHRYYDPEVGRYLRVDPLGIEGGLNLFAFVNNSPTYYVDPLGLKCSGCQEISRNYSKSFDLPSILGAKVTLAFKGTIKGEKCKECCPDGTCGDKISLAVSISGTLEGAFKTGNAGAGFVEVGLGFVVAVAGSGDVSGTASASCDSNCSEFSGKVTGSIKVGVYGVLKVFGYGAEAFGGGEGKVCGSITLKICTGGQVDFSLSGITYGGEIYATLSFEFGGPSTEFKYTIWKGGGC